MSPASGPHLPEPICWLLLALQPGGPQRGGTLGFCTEGIGFLFAYRFDFGKDNGLHGDTVTGSSSDSWLGVLPDTYGRNAMVATVWHIGTNGITDSISVISVPVLSNKQKRENDTFWRLSRLLKSWALGHSQYFSIVPFCQYSSSYISGASNMCILPLLNNDCSNKKFTFSL